MTDSSEKNLPDVRLLPLTRRDYALSGADGHDSRLRCSSGKLRSSSSNRGAATAAAPEPTSHPRRPKILKLRLAGDIAGIDPAFMVSLTDSLISDCVFSGLVMQKQGAYEWKNDLVEEIKQSEDGKTIDFTAPRLTGMVPATAMGS